MRLLKLKLTNVYSSLNKEITFNDDLNLLVGINGSGKTTILNFIDWLITPNLARLATTKFEKVELSFFHGEERQTLYATQDSRTMKWRKKLKKV